MSIKRILSALFLFCMLAFSAEARYITPKSAITSSAFNNTVNITVTIENAGDESAYDILPVIIYFNKTFSGGSRISLKPGESYTWDFLKALPKVRNGEYPLIVQTHYNDANGYKFSATSLHHIEIGEAMPSAIIGKVDNVKMKDSGKIVLIVKNTDKVIHNAKVTLLLPKELSSQKTEEKLFIEPNEEIKLEFGIHNFAALKDSTYASYILLEYENEQYHFLESLSSIIYIKDSANIQTNPLKNIRFLLLFISLIALASLYFYKKRKIKR